MRKSFQLISIFICMIAILVFVGDTVDPATAVTIFSAVIAGLTATAQAGQVAAQLAGDAVAIKIGNHFRYVNLVREAEYIYDGEEYVTPAMTISPGDEDCAGGFDDGWWNWGGVAGSVRYSLNDPHGYTYCMDVLYANDQGDFGGYDGWAVAVGSDLCNLGIQAVFNDWKAHKSFFSSSSMGAGYAFGGNTWTSYGTAGNNGYKTTSNSDYKISWKVDMNNQGVATLTVEVGPYNYWKSGDTYFAGAAPNENIDIDHNFEVIKRSKQVDYNYYNYKYILLIGVIMFILINNMFIGYCCLKKAGKSKQYAKVEMNDMDNNEV